METRYNSEEIKAANKTCRTNGASAMGPNGEIRAIVPKYVAKIAKPEMKILDFGAGKEAIHTKWLRDQGFNVTAWEFGSNFVEGIHDPKALEKQYDLVFASNVLNVQTSAEMLRTTLIEMKKCLNPSGMIIANFPKTPRKIDMESLVKVTDKIFPHRMIHMINNNIIYVIH